MKENYYPYKNRQFDCGNFSRLYNILHNHCFNKGYDCIFPEKWSLRTIKRFK